MQRQYSPSVKEDQKESGRGTGTLVAVAVAVLSYSIMNTLVVPALPVFQQSLHTSSGWAAWLLSGFLLGSVTATPLVSRMGDQYGKRRLLVAVLVVYLLGTVGAAMAWNIAALIVFRAVEGVSMAILPLALAIVRDELPPGRVSLGLGLISGLLGLGGGIGLVAGGLLVDYTSWRFLFIAAAVVIVAALALVLCYVPPDQPMEAEAHLDLPGAGVLSLALVALLLALTEGPSWGWLSLGVLGLFAASAVLVVALVAVERQALHPLVDISAFVYRPMLMTHAAAFVFGVTSFVFYVLLPRFAQLRTVYGFGASATMAGLFLLPSALVLALASASAGLIGNRLGPRALLALGLGITAAGAVLLAVAHAHIWQLVVFYLVVGVGSGLVLGVLPQLIATIVKPDQMATANGLNNIARTVDGAIGSQLAAALVASQTIKGTTLPAESGFVTAFWLSAAVAVAGTLLTRYATVSRGQSRSQVSG